MLHKFFVYFVCENRWVLLLNVLVTNWQEHNNMHVSYDFSLRVHLRRMHKSHWYNYPTLFITAQIVILKQLRKESLVELLLNVLLS